MLYVAHEIFFLKWAPSKCHIGTNKTGQNIPREVPGATSWNANFKIYPGRTPVAPITCTCTSYRAHLIGPLGLTSGHRPSTVPPHFSFTYSKYSCDCTIIRLRPWEKGLIWHFWKKNQRNSVTNRGRLFNNVLRKV